MTVFVVTACTACSCVTVKCELVLYRPLREKQSREIECIEQRDARDALLAILVEIGVRLVEVHSHL